MCEFAIFAEKEAYLTSSNADITCWDILVRTNVMIKFLHESLAETHYLSIGTAADREVRTTLTATHRQRGERILECLLEAKEFHDAQVHRVVEAKSAFVWADSSVELYAVTCVNVYLTIVVCPWHAEHIYSFRLDETLNEMSFFKLRMLVVYIFNRYQYLFYCLKKFRFARVFPHQAF